MILGGSTTYIPTKLNQLEIWGRSAEVFYAAEWVRAVTRPPVRVFLQRRYSVDTFTVFIFAEIPQNPSMSEKMSLLKNSHHLVYATSAVPVGHAAVPSSGSV